MTVLDHFSVPYLGLKSGKHTLYFDGDLSFFKCFEFAGITDASFKVVLELDKRPNMSIADFSISGEVQTDCDRCLSALSIPLAFDTTLHIKYGDEDLDNDEVMFIHPDTSIVNFAQVVYEFILLHLPLIKVHSHWNDCDQKIIEKLKPNVDRESDSIWTSLNNLDLN